MMIHTLMIVLRNKTSGRQLRSCGIHHKKSILFLRCCLLRPSPTSFTYHHFSRSPTMTTRQWACMCGNFEGKVDGDPALACWCYCGMCRKQMGAPAQLGVWTPAQFTAVKGDEKLIKYTSNGTVFRNSCPMCGSFCYKVLPDGNIVIPLGTLEPYVAPTCNIFVGSKGAQPIIAADLPSHEEFP